MAITTADKLVLLRGAYREASTSGKRLCDVLAAKADALITGLASGQVIQSTASPGLQVAFSKPGEGAHTPQETARAYDELLKVLEDERAALIAEGTLAPEDDDLLAAIEAAIDVETSVFTTEFTTAAW